MGDDVDGNLLILHGDTAAAQADLDAFHALCRQWWPTQGYDVDAGGVIPKNAATGEDEPDCQRTTCWDTLKPDPTDPGKSWWISPTPDLRFYDWKTYLAATGYTLQCAEITMPAEWQETGEI